MLRAAGYEVVARPGDGACFYWSDGTASGRFTRDDFGPDGKLSPQGADDVAKQQWLQAQRNAVVAQLRAALWLGGRRRGQWARAH